MFERTVGQIRSIDYNSILDQAIDEKRYFILDLIRSQLSKGERSGGDAIGEYATDENGFSTYVVMKFEKGLFQGQQGSTTPKVDLLLTGSFYRSLNLTVTKNDIVIEALDSKADKLDDMYNLSSDAGGGALELNEENMIALQKELLPIIQRKLKNKFK